MTNQASIKAHQSQVPCSRFGWQWRQLQIHPTKYLEPILKYLSTSVWVVEANPETIRERQSGNPEGFSNPGELPRIPIRKKNQSGASKSQSGPGLNHANGYDHDCCGQFGDCGLVATTTATATTTTAAAQRRQLGDCGLVATTTATATTTTAAAQRRRPLRRWRW